MLKAVKEMDKSRAKFTQTLTHGAQSFIDKPMKSQPKIVKSETFVTHDENI